MKRAIGYWHNYATGIRLAESEWRRLGWFDWANCLSQMADVIEKRGEPPLSCELPSRGCPCHDLPNTHHHFCHRPGFIPDHAQL